MFDENEELYTLILVFLAEIHEMNLFLPDTPAFWSIWVRPLPSWRMLDLVL
jgi:hypothetical protein